MNSSAVFYCFVIVGFLTNPLFSYVLEKPKHIISKDTAEAPPRRQHVARIPSPNEIDTSSLSELTHFVGAASEDNYKTDSEIRNQQSKNVLTNKNDNVLGFSDLLTLLALWHLANEYNNYHIKPEQRVEDLSSEEEPSFEK